MAFKPGPEKRVVFAKKGALAGKEAIRCSEAGAGKGPAPWARVWPGGREHMAGDGTCSGGHHAVKDLVYCTSHRGGKAPGVGGWCFYILTSLVN